MTSVCVSGSILKTGCIRYNAGRSECSVTRTKFTDSRGTVGGNPQPGVQTFDIVYSLIAGLIHRNNLKTLLYEPDPAEGSIVYLKDVARVELGNLINTVNAFVMGNLQLLYWYTRRREPILWKHTRVLTGH